MNEKVDPLLLLRDWIIQKKPLQIVQNFIEFGNGEMRIQRETQTAW